MHNVYLQNLGIGEIWALRNPASSVMEIDEGKAAVIDDSMMHVLLINPFEEEVMSGMPAPAFLNTKKLYDNIIQEFKNHSDCKLGHASLSKTEDGSADLAENTSGLLALKKQIDEGPPKLIWVLGARLANILMGAEANFTVLEYRNNQKWYQGIPLFVSQELDFLVECPEQKLETWRDLCRIKEVLS